MKYFAFLLLLGTLSLTACQEDGPAEKMGQEIDNAAKEAGDAATDVGNAIEDACEDVTGDNC
tara:strand:+ start:738 stop:923 length:186 start_codon:yes stop_codon:yes gene_type:complete